MDSATAVLSALSLKRDVVVTRCRRPQQHELLMGQGQLFVAGRQAPETLGIISEDNRSRVVPKAGSVFILQADRLKVTLTSDKLSPEKLKENHRQQRVQA
ncbi:hypothetical protein E2562_027552 [Oryza meyeriana var. granulata]|uniref:Uncharacterized protein n=1 Tax=Oryza meyeriana var. granulata TaxID=110450 RepID=A0A6G1CKA9_9ORYZ|nr:hypothetical protein E2562_027552 [Oryza meyeriana var. granulata]